MNSAPIGVFDSGLGGLTALKKLVSLLPNEDVIYLGDTGRVPYGSRSRETIIKYSLQDVEFLLSHGVKAIIAACNTVSAVALDDIDGRIHVPFFEVVTPPSIKAASMTKNKKIGVIGTGATIKSGAYESSILSIDNSLDVISVPCPLLVPLVENGRTDKKDVAVRAIAEDYLKVLKDAGVDTIILGCTHYPLMEEAIADIMGEGVTLIDSGLEAAKYAVATLKDMSLLSDKTEKGKRNYYVTDTVSGFEEQASRFLGDDISGSVSQISLE